MTPTPKLPATRAALLLALAPLCAAAQQAPDQPLWEVGAFGAAYSQQAYPGSDRQVNGAIALPYFVYRGKYFRADRNALGIRALKTPTVEVDIGVSGAFGSSSDDIEARRGMPDLGTLVEFGPRLKWDLGPALGGRWQAEFPLRGVFDLSDGAAHRGVAFEPELSYARATAGGWRYSTGVSAIFADRKLADTFYGVAPRYATPGRPAYTAESGLVAWRLSLSASRQLAPDWRLFAFTRLQSVAGAANRASPLVRQTTGVTVGVGVAYTWAQSDRPAVD
ncbi:MAG: MipA/OmpV family protein [Proteobacteria bacterium]|jgi:outer membrane protein|nr:MipA/OmpV family protein [Ramlibacter sp.]MCA0212965.1 MipA/OmpV family protein [Pseudomonadota bacterium]